MMERRIARRYDLSLPVIIRCRRDGQVLFRTGNTRDISSRGVRFTTDDNLSVGAELDLKIAIPVEVSNGTEVFIRAIGRVVRLDKISDNGDQQVGVAAVIQQQEIARDQVIIA
jgi:hypothetical protein